MSFDKSTKRARKGWRNRKNIYKQFLHWESIPWKSQNVGAISPSFSSSFGGFVNSYRVLSPNKLSVVVSAYLKPQLSNKKISSKNIYFLSSKIILKILIFEKIIFFSTKIVGRNFFDRKKKFENCRSKKKIEQKNIFDQNILIDFFWK